MTSLAMDDMDRKCDRCDRCRQCPFCSSSFTVVNLNGVVVERRCHKCNAYTESYLDPL